MTTWRKVRKKPGAVEAWGPWDGTRPAAPDGLSLLEWCGEDVEESARHMIVSDVTYQRRGAAAEILYFTVRVCLGDYIIRHADGRLEVCRPDVFAETYEVGEDICRLCHGDPLSADEQGNVDECPECNGEGMARAQLAGLKAQNEPAEVSERWKAGGGRGTVAT